VDCVSGYVCIKEVGGINRCSAVLVMAAGCRSDRKCY